MSRIIWKLSLMLAIGLFTLSGAATPCIGSRRGVDSGESDLLRPGAGRVVL